MIPTTYSLRSSLARACSSRPGVGLEDDLGDPVAVAEVDEEQPAEVAPGVDPAVQDDMLPDVVGGQVAASMSSFEEHDQRRETREFSPIALVATITLLAANRQGVEDSDTAGVVEFIATEVAAQYRGRLHRGGWPDAGLRRRQGDASEAVSLLPPGYGVKPAVHAAPGEGRGVGRKVVGTVVVFDPGAKPLGRMGQPIGLEPGGVLIEWLVQVFRSEERDVAELDGKGIEGALGWRRRGGPSGRGRRRARSGRPPTCSGSRADRGSARGGRSSDRSSRRVGRRVALKGRS